VKPSRQNLTNKVIEKVKKDGEVSMKLDCCAVDKGFRTIARIMLASDVRKHA
jgi:hypothetical protein